MTGLTSLIGRERELARLLAGLGGDGRLLLVVGDTGVGKTRLAREGMARVAAAGMVTARGECLPLAGMLPLLPVAAALGELAGVDDGGLLAAALNACPEYVRGEIERLLPGLAPAGARGLSRPYRGWQRERLFCAVADLLDEAAGVSGAPIGLLIEDVHWADSATLDCVTFLARAGRRYAVTVVATCRSDEAPVAGHVTDWLAQVRAAAWAEEIRLGPMSRAEADDLAAVLAGGPVPPRVAGDLYARAEGNPFFTQQMVAAALASGESDGFRVPAGLPARLTDMLMARARRCAGDARVVLSGLAVAGRPVTEDMLGAITGLGLEAVRSGLRELAAARLLAEDRGDGTLRLRHALLGEAMAGGLLPGERATLHERTALALAAVGDGKLAADIAGHWQAANRPAEELAARVEAAAEAEGVFDYTQATAHWLRAVELCQVQPGAAGRDVPGLYLRAIDACSRAGAGERAGELAEEACRRFAGHADPAVAAAVRHSAACCRAIGTADLGTGLIDEALRLYERASPSVRHAEAWLDYSDIFLRSPQGRLEDMHRALRRALELAEEAGAEALVPRALASLAANAFRRGNVEEGQGLLQRARAQAEAAQDGMALVWLAVIESYALHNLARFDRAAEVAAAGLEAARRAGLEGSWRVGMLTSNAAAALMARGRTAEAAALIDPLTAGPPDVDHWVVHGCRARLDLLRGELGAAGLRHQLLRAIPAHASNLDFARAAAEQAAELALWAGRPADARAEAERVLLLFTNPDRAVFCGHLLATGMRACADLAERARACRDAEAAAAADTAADGLVSWSDRQMRGIPFAEHPFVATIPAERATWEAERTRLAGASDPDAWSGAAKAWQEAGCLHRAGYAWWRQAEAQLDSGQQAAAAATLRAAANAARGHAPLLAQVRGLGRRARIPLRPSPRQGRRRRPGVPAAYGLTGREQAVLRLLAAGRTNAEIGAELYISPSTAGVHVSRILRKLGVTGRVQAATVAERAGLLRPGSPKQPEGQL